MLIKFYYSCVHVLSKLGDLSSLFFRLILAYRFYEPAMTKLTHFSSIVEWFTHMNYIFPTLMAFLVTAAESSGVILLTLGLGTRIIAIPLSITMVVAIITVHWVHGFSASQNGFETPLYCLLMLFSLLVRGAGKYSIDYFLGRQIQGRQGRQGPQGPQ